MGQESNLTRVKRRSLARRIGRAMDRVFATPVPVLKSMDYDNYWEKRSVDDFHPRFQLVAELIPRGTRVLDIGCGDGSLLLYLATERETTGSGVDVSEVAVRHARAKGLECDVTDVTEDSYRVPRNVDVVVISEVLEHIPDPEALLLRISEADIPRVLVTVPNTGYLEHRLRLLFGRFPVQWLLHPGEHLRFWTIADFRATASATGFRVVRIVPALGWFPLARIRPSLFASQIIYELKPDGAKPSGADTS